MILSMLASFCIRSAANLYLQRSYLQMTLFSAYWSLNPHGSWIWPSDSTFVGCVLVLGFSKAFSCPFGNVVCPLFLLSARLSATFHHLLEDGLWKSAWSCHMTIPFQLPLMMWKPWTSSWSYNLLMIRAVRWTC